MENLRVILLAEDNPNDAELTLAALADLKLANPIIAVSDGAQALEYLHYEGKYSRRAVCNPAVILLDIKMPLVNGIEVLQIIRKDPVLKSIPVVMLTSSREEPDLKKCYDLGVNAYVVKPVDFKDFFEAIKQLGVFWALINELPPEQEK